MTKFIKSPNKFAVDVSIAAGKKIYLDGGGNTYITESSGDLLRLYSGGNIVFEGNGVTDVAVVAQRTITLAPAQNGVSGNVAITGDTNLAAQKKLYFDGGSDTYIHENVTDNIEVVVGGDAMMTLRENGNAGNTVDFLTSGAGFTQHEPSYNATDTNVYFNRNGNKGFVTFGSGNITDLNLYFPNVSCNCLLVIKQDGTGSRTVTNWKTFDQVAFNASTVKWPGGSPPTLSTGADAVDIISFYWDNDNHTAYGVASLNFS